jgi:hypothetical protein
MSAYIYIRTRKIFLSNDPVGDQEGDRTVQSRALKTGLKVLGELK